MSAWFDLVDHSCRALPKPVEGARLLLESKSGEFHTEYRALQVSSEVGCRWQPVRVAAGFLSRHAATVDTDHLTAVWLPRGARWMQSQGDVVPAPGWRRLWMYPLPAPVVGATLLVQAATVRQQFSGVNDAESGEVVWRLKRLSDELVTPFAPTAHWFLVPSLPGVVA